jgi:hypothetical protein
VTFGAEDDKRNLGADETAYAGGIGLRELARKAGIAEKTVPGGKKDQSHIAVNIAILNA